jgi:carbonic anhydrase/acetyltransferase-like protein (isoleucine patch superfamily)
VLKLVLYEFEDKKPQISDSAFIFPTATIIGDVKIGDNCFIAPHAVLRGDWGSIEIGAGSNIQDTCVVHSIPDGKTLLGDNCHVGHGAVVHQATLGEHVLVGINAVIGDHAEIGDNCIIGEGALVPRRMKVEEESIVLGVPGKIVGKLKDTQLEYSWWATKLYQTLPSRYKESLKRLE